VTLCEHLDGRVTIVYGPHQVGEYTAEGPSLAVGKNGARHAVEMTHRGKRGKVKRRTFPLFPPRLEIRPQAKTPDLHIPTASTAADSPPKTQERRKSKTGQIMCYKNRTS
jgi:hypothetical protein